MYQDDDKDKIQKDDKSKKINFEIMDLEWESLILDYMLLHHIFKLTNIL